MTAGLKLVYHVPRSQVWAGSRGRQTGNVHLHVTEPVKLGRLVRGANRALCGRDGWYERSLYDGEREAMCPRCKAAAERHGLSIPTTEGETR